MPLAAGTHLGPYEIVGVIGAGGMGQVYRARDPRLDRSVAIKVLPEDLSVDPDRRARFEREAKAVAALSHPNILAIYDYGEQGGVYYAATELLEGTALREQLQDGPLPARKAIDLGVQIARGLAAAHDRGIVHRDLKPENLFLVAGGQIKILDFGIAKAIEANPAAAATRTRAAADTDPGTVIGTVGYMAPEQVRGLPLDARADLFSLGAVLYEMVTGRRAFERATTADTMSAILREDPPEIAASQSGVPPALDRIIRHCLEKDPGERFQTARDVAFALASLSGSATHSTAVAPVMPDRTGWRRHVWTAAAVLAAVAVGVVIGRALTATAPELTFAARTRSPQMVFNARFMPDGKTLIFSSAFTGSDPSLFESREDGGAPRPFGPPRTHLLSISKSGELAVITGTTHIGHRVMGGTLARMTVDGAPRPIAEDVRDADWLPDGTDLVVIRGVGGRDQLEFPVGRIVHQSSGYLSDPRVSPDGTRVAFMEHTVRFDNRGWVKVVDRGGTVTTLAGEHRGEEGVAWSPDSRSVLFAATDEDEYTIRSVRVAGGKADVVVHAPGSYFIFDVAADGRMAISRQDNRYGVVARGAGQDVERELTLGDKAWMPWLSDDGRWVLMTDGRGGHDYAVMLRNVDGSPPSRLGDGQAGGFSPDGKWVTAKIFSTGRCVLYPIGAGTPIPIELGALEQCSWAVWFPDGKSLLVVGNEPGKPERDYRVSFPGGKPEPLLADGFSVGQISKDGRRFLVRDRKRAWYETTLGGVPQPLKALRASDSVVDWPAEQTVVVSSETVPAEIARVQLDTGTRTRLGDLGPGDRAGLQAVLVNAYRDNGRQYTYGYVRRVSVVFVATPSR